MTYKSETPEWSEVGLPAEFLSEATRRCKLNEEKARLEKAIAEIDNYLTVQLTLLDAKSVKIGDLGTIGRRTNVNSRIDPKLLMKNGVKMSVIEASTVKTESREYIQYYPKASKKEKVEDGE